MSTDQRDVPEETDVGLLVVQTGMPPNITSRSREIIYDALQLNVRFIMNKFGPWPLNLTRSNMHW